MCVRLEEHYSLVHLADELFPAAQLLIGHEFPEFMRVDLVSVFEDDEFGLGGTLQEVHDEKVEQKFLISLMEVSELKQFIFLH